MNRHLAIVLIPVLVTLSGCVTPQPKDYTEFRKHQPRSILVLPPLNETTEVMAGYSVLTTATRPLSEMGYYVYPVDIVDQFLKENGLPTALEMHQAPLNKIHEVFGADAILYMTVEQYGTKYHIISSDTTIAIHGKLLDGVTGISLWEGRVVFTQGNNSGGGDPIGMLVGAVINQVVNKALDHAHLVAAQTSVLLLTPPKQGLLRGPRHPEFGKPE